MTIRVHGRRGLGWLAVGVIVLSACATPRAALGPEQSPCFRSLPVAADVLGHRGRFAGVILTRVPQPGARRPFRSAASTAGSAVTGATSSIPAASTTTTVPSATSTMPLLGKEYCLVAFEGAFDSSVPLLRGSQRTGRFAIVVVTLRSHRAVAVYLHDRLPRSFRRP